MNYMIMTLETGPLWGGRSLDWIKEMIDFIQQIDREPAESGKLNFSRCPPMRRRRNSQSPKGVLVVTDDPFAESRGSLAGLRVVDVESETPAIEIAMKISGAAEAPIEVRRCMDA